MQHVMLDLETFGNGSTASIISIGAVKFDPNTMTRVDDSFYVAVDPESCAQYGLKIDAGTILWWMQPDQTGAREDWLKTEKLDLASALEGFAMWFGANSMPVWGNGATFDNVILRNAYQVTGLECPWSFRHDRCYRTFKSIAPAVEMQRVGQYHNVVDDAISQAHHLQDIVAHIGLEL